MSKIKFSVCKWQGKMKIIRDFAGEYVIRRGIRWLFFECYVVIPLPILELCNPEKQTVTTEGRILTTESDEQDRLYICNRTRGFEISYHDCEIILKNGKISIYRHKEDVLEHIPFEDSTLNQTMNI